MVSRKNQKAKKEAEEKAKQESHSFAGSKNFKPGTAMRDILEQAEQNYGTIKIRNKASYDGKGITILSIVSCLHILADPTHRENNWSCLVEMVKYDDEAYLRLVPSIPLEVKVKWETTGTPPRQMVSNDVQVMITEMLGKADRVTPAKINAKIRPDNPFPLGIKSHDVFNMAADWIPLRTLLAQIRDELSEGNMDNARGLWKRVGVPKRNGGLSVKNVKVVNKVKMVKFVRIGQPSS